MPFEKSSVLAMSSSTFPLRSAAFVDRNASTEAPPLVALTSTTPWAAVCAWVPNFTVRCVANQPRKDEKLVPSFRFASDLHIMFADHHFMAQFRQFASDGLSDHPGSEFAYLHGDQYGG